MIVGKSRRTHVLSLVALSAMPLCACDAQFLNPQGEDPGFGGEPSPATTGGAQGGDAVGAPGLPTFVTPDGNPVAPGQAGNPTAPPVGTGVVTSPSTPTAPGSIPGAGATGAGAGATGAGGTGAIDPGFEPEPGSDGPAELDAGGPLDGGDSGAFYDAADESSFQSDSPELDSAAGPSGSASP